MFFFRFSFNDFLGMGGASETRRNDKKSQSQAGRETENIQYHEKTSNV